MSGYEHIGYADAMSLARGSDVQDDELVPMEPWVCEECGTLNDDIEGVREIVDGGSVRGVWLEIRAECEYCDECGEMCGAVHVQFDQQLSG
ncbi:hypothetical protein UFOVP1279_6 [uncultured Caudovirales phage]|uniref:Uncharacterized protein n=1 Tax=uncultured Caudovirales phage TaxID=2100421 RepID=A0A6J5RMQ2_9CAUD|nr:hypothetical protein UFOVP1279_6 [uncultured Caudovirales phage]